MKKNLLILFSFIMIIKITVADARQKYKINPKDIKEFITEKKSWNKKHFKIIESSKSLVSSTVETEGEKQKMFFYIVKVHPKKCDIALRRLSQYEDYHKFSGFITKSLYHDKSQRVYFLLSSYLLPYDMSLSFKIPRINKPGDYPFVFDSGIFLGLNGVIRAKALPDKSKGCLLMSKASWIGKSTGISDTVVELFSEGLSKLAMDKIVRSTSF